MVANGWPICHYASSHKHNRFDFFPADFQWLRHNKVRSARSNQPRFRYAFHINEHCRFYWRGILIFMRFEWTKSSHHTRFPDGFSWEHKRIAILDYFFSEFNRFSNLKEFQFQILFSFFGVVKNVVDDLFKLNAIGISQKFSVGKEHLASIEESYWY